MYISTDVAERIKEMAKVRSISVKHLLEDVGLGFNTMSNMKTSMPKADNLARIADQLNCSVDYLLGRTSIPATEIPSNIGFITPLEAKVLLAYREKKDMQRAIEHLLDIDSSVEQTKKPDIIIGQIAAFGSGPTDVPVNKEASQKLAALAKKKRTEKKEK